MGICEEKLSHAEPLELKTVTIKSAKIDHKITHQEKKILKLNRKQKRKK